MYFFKTRFTGWENGSRRDTIVAGTVTAPWCFAIIFFKHDSSVCKVVIGEGETEVQHIYIVTLHY